MNTSNDDQAKEKADLEVKQSEEREKLQEEQQKESDMEREELKKDADTAHDQSEVADNEALEKENKEREANEKLNS